MSYGTWISVSNWAIFTLSYFVINRTLYNMFVLTLGSYSFQLLFFYNWLLFFFFFLSLILSSEMQM